VLIPATQLRAGMTIIHNNDPHRVMEVQHVTPGNWRGMVHAKLRNLRSGSQSQTRYRSVDQVERAEMEQHEMEYLYTTGDEFVFMNTETYDQMSLDRDTLGEAVKYLLPNMKLQIEFFEGKPVGIDLPKTVDLKVTYTEPGLKGATVTNVTKPAKMETGLIVQVPPFICEGEKIRVNTAEGTYLERA